MVDKTGYNAHTVATDEVVSDEELFRYKVKLKIKKTMKAYNDMLDKATTDVVDEMIGNKGPSIVTSKSNVVNKKLEDGVISKLSAQEFVDLIDDIVYNQLYGVYREIIHNRYMEEMSVEETYRTVRKEFLKVPRKSNKYGIATFYRDKWKAEVAFYKKINKNINKF